MTKLGKGRRKVRIHFRRMIFTLTLFSLAVLAIILIINFILSERTVNRLAEAEIPDWISVQLIEQDGVSRTGRTLEAVNDIVIHYVGNPGTTAMQNRDFFNSPTSQVSAHFVVGLDGEIIQCVPLYEWSSASNQRNPDTISIEVCHPDAAGKFTKASYDAVVRLTAWLCDTAKLDRKNVIRHYDVTGKECPLYYVKNEDAWEQFKEDVLKYR